MKPTRISVSGLGPHVETNIEFEGASQIALLAPYGTGKTSLLESLLICLYGRGAWYDGTPYDLMTQGGDGTAVVELEFEHEGRTYLATRSIKTTAKTKSQTATLILHNWGDREPVAGPNVREFEARIRSMLGDYDTFLATTFLSQNRRGDLCGQPGEEGLVARRRAVFNELLGASELDRIEALAAEAMRSAAARAEELDAQLAGEPDHAETAAQAEAEADALDMEIERRAMEELDARAAVETLSARKLAAEAGDGAALAAVERHEQAMEAERRASRRCDETAERAERLARVADLRPEAEARLAALDEARERRAELQQVHDAWVRWTAWDGERDRLAREMEAAAANLETLKALPGVDDETAAEAKLRNERYDELADASRQAGEAKAEAERIETERREAARRVDVAEASLRGLRLRLERRPETPGGEICAACPLAAEWASLPAEIAQAEATLAEAQARLAAIPAPPEIPDLTALRIALDRCEAAVKAVKADKARVAALAEAEDRVMDATAVWARHMDEPVPEVEDPRQQIRQVQEVIDGLASAPARMEHVVEAEAQLAEAREAERAAHAEWMAAAELAERLAPEADAARAALHDAEVARAGLLTELEAARRRQALATDARREAERRLATARERASNARARMAETEAKRQRAAETRARIEALRDVRMAFGPRGARQILIDAAAPELERIADDLFDRATGGRMRLRISTQRQMADGSLGEDFAIMVRDAAGERDATRYSGGQLQLIQIVFRLAVSLWLGHMRGHAPEFLVLDEAFDRLGADGTDDLLRVLDHLAGQIGRVVVVTHDPQIAERFPSHVRLARGARGVRVLTQEAAPCA